MQFGKKTLKIEVHQTAHLKHRPRVPLQSLGRSVDDTGSGNDLAMPCHPDMEVQAKGRMQSFTKNLDQLRVGYSQLVILIVFFKLKSRIHVQCRQNLR